MSDSWLVQHVWLIPLLPLLASVATAILGPTVLRERSHWPCLAASAFAAVLSFLLLFTKTDLANPTTPAVYDWISVGLFEVSVVLRVDPLTCLMLVMVTSVGSLIVLYSVGYMHGELGYWRFFTFVALFLFSMTMLVLASNFLLLFVFWEAVGLCSYLLIGFWYHKPSAAAAAKKAFLVNRVGDFAFALGILLVWIHFGVIDPVNGYGRLDYDHAFANVQNITDTALLAICLLLFCGAVGKSAQFPLHVWLPDAMEGPTPVSALIHAATMVTAGVYMIARLSPLFFASPGAQLVVASIGGFTALLAALIALTQNDLKRILAYSTVSQLGYMFLALGCGSVFAVTAAVFHVFTHAFFKALLFLGAGSVMHAMGNVIDITKFSGLRHRLPRTHWTFACGAASLAGIPLLSGFWSKDEILAAVLHRSHEQSGIVFQVLLVMAIVTAFLTAFYTFRAYFKTFWGDEVIPPEAGDHAHESPPVMTYPLMVLAIFALGMGLVLSGIGIFLDKPTLIGQFLGHMPGWSEHTEHNANWGLMIGSGVLALAGMALAWWMYGRSTTLPDLVARKIRPAYNLSRNKFWFDEIYQATVVGPTVVIAHFGRFFDNWIVDGLVHVVSATPRFLGRRFLRPIQNGLIQFYALGMVIGLVILVLAIKLLG